MRQLSGYVGIMKYCGDVGMLVSEYFELDDELDKIGVFCCILDNDSSFF